MKIKTLLIASLIGGGVSAVDAASIKSFSTEKFVKYDNDDVYWEVGVTCSTSKNKRIIRQAIKGKQWCSKEAPQLCKSSKMDAAKEVCSNKYKKAVKAEQSAAKKSAQQPAPIVKPKVVAKKVDKPNNVPAPAVMDELSIQQNQVSIEEQRLNIEQQKLELRKRELELQKQEIKLKQQQQLMTR